MQESNRGCSSFKWNTLAGMRRVFCYALLPTRFQLAGTLRDQTSVDGTWCRWRTGSCVNVLGRSSVAFFLGVHFMTDSAMQATVPVVRQFRWTSLAKQHSELGVSYFRCAVCPGSGVALWASHGHSQFVCGTSRHRQKTNGLPMTSMSGVFIEC